MKAALLLPLLVLACVALAEGHTRRTLAPTPPRTATAGTATTTTPPQGTIQTSKGPVKVGTVAAGNARPKKGQQATSKGTTGAAKINWGQAESCRSVGLREHCDTYEQANCCEYLGSNDKWQGCDIASNLYTCTSQFDNKPVSVCCS